MKRLLLPAMLAAMCALIAVPTPSQAATAPAILEWTSAIPGWNNAYYWYDTDGNRYAFTAVSSYESWFPGEPTGVKNATIEELAPIPLKGAVPHRPGVRLIQFESSPQVYAVDRFGVLRWLTSEQVAFEIYDEQWTDRVDLLPVTDYPLYRFGSPITDPNEFDPHAWDHLTSPATNVVNATQHPPDALTGAVTLSANTAGPFTVGESIQLTATVASISARHEQLTLRVYNAQEQIIGSCVGVTTCRVDTIVGGPVGDQHFTARAFNEYGQAIASEPLVRFVQNPQQ